jgi:hypothetical protein
MLSGRTTQHTVSEWLQVYFDMMVIISIFAHKAISTAISCIILILLTQKDPTKSKEQIACRNVGNCTDIPCFHEPGL